MKCFIAPCLAVLALSPAAHAVDVTVGPSTAPWVGFMSVSNLPADGGAFQFQGGWGVGDTVATFDDGAGTLTLTPNTIGDANEYWYKNTSGTAPDPVNPGGPGQLGNKQMTASVFIEEAGTFAGDTVTFAGNVDSNTFTGAHVTTIFINEFDAAFNLLNQVTAPATAGAFSISLAADVEPTNIIQYGFQTIGENVWVTDTAPFGSVVLSPVPEPASLALLGMGGLALLGRRNRG